MRGDDVASNLKLVEMSEDDDLDILDHLLANLTGENRRDYV